MRRDDINHWDQSYSLTMEWTDAQQQELHRFLASFTNPDPRVQASNLQQLEALAQHPRAFHAVCSAVCDTSISATVRLSATTVARQLLRRPARLSFYLESNASGLSVQNALPQLLSGLLDSSFHDVCSSHPAPLQRATMSLIAALLKAAAMDLTCFAAATSAWCDIVSFLSRITAHTSPASEPSSATPSGSFESATHAAVLLRELCEVTLTGLCPLREWVGERPQQTTILCALLSQLLLSLQSTLRLHFESNSVAISRTQALTTWMENVLAAFSSLVDSGALPSTAPDFIENTHAASNDGPAVQALKSVSATVVQVHTCIQDMTLSIILKPLALWSDSVGSAAPAPTPAADLQRLVLWTAPFIAVTMRYMVDVVLLESFDEPNGRFQCAAMPLLSTFCCSAAATQLLYDGAGDADSVHAAVVACVNYTAQLVHVGHFLGLPPSQSGKLSNPSELHGITVSYVACVYRLLVSAATLPTSIAEQLDEHTVQQPDSAAELLVKSATSRRRGQHGAKATAASKNAGVTADFADDRDAGNDAGNGNVEEEGDATGIEMVDALEAQLPDNGTLRRGVAWCANSLTCNVDWIVALAPLVIAAIPLPVSVHLSDFCAVEVALFICNETLDAVLAEKRLLSSSDAAAAASGEQIAAQLRSVLALLSESSASATTTGASAPFFVRAQAARFLGRLGCGLMEPWKGLQQGVGGSGLDGCVVQAFAHRTCSALSPAGGLEGVLWTLTQVLNSEVNKAVQVECAGAVTSLVSNCLRTLDVLLRAAEKQHLSDDSELEEESLSDSGDGTELASDAQPPGASAASETVRLFCQSLGLAPGLAVFPQAVQLLSHSFPRLQWSVRQSIYHLFSEVLPPLWSLTQQHHHPQQQSLELWACGDQAAAAAARSLVRAVTKESLEVLAAHYTALFVDVRNSLFEMASLLSCMADVASAMDAAALEAVLPWILQVAHHVLNLYAEYLAGAAHSDPCATLDSSNCSTNRSGGSQAFLGAAVDMTDMCMVSLDLISCACDGLVDRDALLAAQLYPQRQAEAAVMDARVMSLAAALLSPSTERCDGTSSAAPSSDALPSQCVALLLLCQTRSDHPSHVIAPEATAATAADLDAGGYIEGVVRSADAFGELRRACFAVLYDCIFLLAYSQSLFRPSTTQTSPAAAGCGISAALGKDLLMLCLREVAPCGPAVVSLPHGMPSVEYLKAVSTQNAAASDAWLCLGALLSLWDQQSCSAQKRSQLSAVAPSNGSHNGSTAEAHDTISPASLFSPAVNPDAAYLCQNVHHIFDSLLQLLSDKKFTTESYLRLNMTSAMCGLATLLADHSPSEARAALLQSRLPWQTTVALLAVVSSTRVREYVPDVASGEDEGMSEAAQILWCLGRVWHSAVLPLPHDALCAVLRAQGKEVAKTAAWLLRCISKHVAPLSLPACPFWASLLELWRPLALTLTQASQAGVFPLTLAQSSALLQLVEL